MPPAVVTAVVGAVATAGTAIATFVTGTGFFASLAKSFIISTITSIAINALAPKPKLGFQEQTLRDRKEMIRQPLSPRRMIYGRSKVSGTILFLESANNNQDIYIVIALAGHEIDGIDRIYFGDTPVAFDGDVTTGFRSAHSSSDFASYASIQVLTGTTTQTLPTAFTNVVELSSTDKFKGIAILCAKLTYNSKAYPNGVPIISAIVRGKKIYNIHDTTVRYSNNPAYVFRDYLKDTTFGLSVSDSELDDTQLNSSATTADSAVVHKDDNDNRTFSAVATTDGSVNHYVHDGATISLHDGDKITISGTSYYVILSDGLTKIHNTTYKAQAFRLATNLTNYRTRTANHTIGSGTVTCERTHEIGFGCDGTLLSSSQHKENIESILTSCGGTMTYSGGVFRMDVASYTAPDNNNDLGDDDIIGDISLVPKIPRRDRFNGIRGTFIGPENGYQGADFPSFQQTSFSNADGEVIFRDFQQNMCISGTQAQRIAKTLLFQSRNELTMKLNTTLKGLRLLPNDRVRITHSRFGFTNQIFKVNEVSIASSADTGIAVSLLLREDTPQAYDFDVNSEMVIVDPTPDTDLPTFRTVATPTISSFANVGDLNNDGTFLSSVKVVFAESTSGFIKKTIIELQAQLSGSFVTVDTQVVESGITETRFGGLIVGRVYRVRIKCVSFADVESAFATSSNLTITADTTAPSAFGALTANAVGGGVELVFTNPSTDDFRGAEFVMRTGTGNPNSGGDATINFSVAGSKSKAMRVVRSNLTAGTQQRFWIRSTDFSGNGSAFFPNNADGITATPTSGQIDVKNSAGSSIVSNGVVTLGAFGTVSQITGGNVANLIADNAIIAGKLSANAVVADNIASGSITSGKLTTGSAVITNTAQIQDAIISSAKISSINAGTISAGNLNADRISGGTLTIGNVNVSGAFNASNISDAVITQVKGGTIGHSNNSGFSSSTNFSTVGFPFNATNDSNFNTKYIAILNVVGTNTSEDDPNTSSHGITLSHSGVNNVGVSVSTSSRSERKVNQTIALSSSTLTKGGAISCTLQVNNVGSAVGSVLVIEFKA